ncbi:MAG TPA: N-acetylmuramoyl-L-alanine amidase [Chondromyces sp.]|nr:N-acetylmuramoyl-L-alanine amidase [Chondromyces sp.]
MKLYLDPGHGGSDPGAHNNELLEKDVSLDIALRIHTVLLNEYEDVEIRLSRKDDSRKSLSQRTKEANSWGADYYLSIHCNAFNGSAQGYEDYIYSGISDSSTTAKYQDIIHGEIVKWSGLKDRKKKKANFQVLRETKMPALLTENGFIDNEHDAALMKQLSWRQKIAQGYAAGIAKAFRLQSKTHPCRSLYKIIAGSFRLKGNADKLVSFLRKKGIESFADTIIINGETWYRVQAGSFSSRNNAEKYLEEVKKAGMKDAFLTTEHADSASVHSSIYSIQGPTSLPSEQMNQFVKGIHPDAIELGIYYLTFGKYYGIRGDIAFAQAMHETDYLRFTGIVRPAQNNFCGLGATGPKHPGASFDTPREGVLAHLQHLYAYTSLNPLPEKYPLVDPRFHLVKRGAAATWIDLNGKWAVPGHNYGQSILNLYEKMVRSTI